MATSNFGVSQFGEQNVYGSPDFVNGIITNEITSENNQKITLYSDSGFYLDGTLTNQDVTIAANTTLAAGEPFFKSIFCAYGTGVAYNLILPPLTATVAGQRYCISTAFGQPINLSASGVQMTGSIVYANGGAAGASTVETQLTTAPFVVGEKTNFTIWSSDQVWFYFGVSGGAEP